MAARFTQDYVLRIISDVQNASTQVEKIEALVDKLVTKDQFIKLVLNKDAKNMPAFIKQIATEAGLTDDQFKLLTKTISDVAKSFHFLKRNINFNDVLGQKDRIEDLKKSLSSFSDIANKLNFSEGIKAQIASVAESFKKVESGTNDLINGFKNVNQSKKQLLTDLKSIQDAASFKLENLGKLGVIENLTGVVKSAKEIEKLSNLSPDKLNKVIDKDVVDLLQRASSLFADIKAGADVLSKQGIINPNSINQLKTLLEFSKEFDKELQKIVSAGQSIDIFKNTSSGKALSGIQADQKVTATNLQDLLTKAQLFTNELIKQGNTFRDIGSQARVFVLEYKNLNTALTKQLSTYDQIKLAQKDLINKVKIDPFDTESLNNLQQSIALEKELSISIDKTTQKLKDSKQQIRDRVKELKEFLTLAKSENPADKAVALDKAGSLFGKDNLARFDDLGQIIAFVKKELKQYAVELDKAVKKTKEVANVNESGIKSFEKMEDSLKNFSFFLNIAIERILRYQIAFLLLGNATKALQNTVIFTKDIEKQIVDLSKVVDAATSNITELKHEAFRFSKTFGKSIKDVIDIMFIWAQQGKSQNDIIKLTNTTLVGMAAGNLTAAEAVETLTSAIRVYNINADDAIIIFDKLINVQRLYAVSTQDLAEAMKLLGATAEEFGIGIDSLFGSVTAIVEVTRKTGSQVANALKTIFAKFTDDDVLKTLRGIGIAVFDTDGKLRDLDNVLDEINAKWISLSEAQRIAIARSVGGIRHYTQFIVLMEQYGTKLRAAEASQRALGFASLAAEKDLNSLANAIERIKAINTEFLEGVGSSTFGFGTTLSSTITALEEIFAKKDNVKGFNKAINEATAFVLHFTATLLTLKGLGLARDFGLGFIAKGIKNEVLEGVTVLNAADEKIDNLLKKNKGKPVFLKSVIGSLGIDQDGQADLARLTAGMKENETRTVKWNGQLLTVSRSFDGLYAKIEKSNLAIAKQISITDRVKNSFKGLATAITSIKTLTGLFLKDLGGMLAFTLALEGIFFAFNKFTKAKKELDIVGVSMQTLTENSINLAGTSNKLLSSIISTSFAFENYNKKLNSATTEEDRIRSAAGLANTFALLRTLIPELNAVNEQLIATTDKGTDADKERAKANEIVTKSIENRLKLTRQFELEANKNAIQNLERIKKEQQELSKLIELSERYNDSRNTKGPQQINVDNFVEGVNALQNALNASQLKDSPFLAEGRQPFREVSTEALAFAESLNKDLLPQLFAINDELNRLRLSNPNLFKELFGDEAFRDFKVIDEFKILKEMRDLGIKIQKIKEADPNFVLTIDFVFNNAPNFSNLIKETEKVRDKTQQLRNEYLNTTSALQQFQEETGRFLGLVGKESTRLTKEIAESISKTKVEIRSLQSEINSEAVVNALSGTPVPLLDTAIKKITEQVSKIDKRKKALEQELQVIIETERILANDSRVKSLNVIKDILKTEAKINYLQTENQKMLSEAPSNMQNLIFESESYKSNLAEITSLEAKKADLLKGVNLQEEFYAKSSAAIREFIGLKINLNELDKQSLAILNQNLDNLEQSLITKKQEVEETLNRENTLGVERQSLQIELEKLAALRGQLALFEKIAELNNQQKQTSSIIANDLIKKLELGNESVSALLDVQNSRLKTQEDITTTLIKLYSNSTTEISNMAGSMQEFINGTKTEQDILDEIALNFDKIGGNGEKIVKQALSEVKALQQTQQIKEKQLNLEASILDIISNATNKVKDYSKAVEITRDLSIEINELMGATNAALDGEKNKQQDLLDLQNEKLKALKNTFTLLSQADSTNSDIYNRIIDNLEKLNKAEKNVAEIFAVDIKRALEKIKPLLESANNRAQDVASSLSSAFGQVNNILITRYQAISDQQSQIAKSEGDIALMKQKQLDLSNRLQSTNFNSLEELNNVKDEYQSITDEIKNAERALQNLEGDLGRIANTNRLFRDIVSNFTTSIGNIVADIQTEQLKNSLTSIFKDSKLFDDVFLTSSEKAARSYAAILADASDKQTAKFKAAFESINTELTSTLRELVSTFNINNSSEVTSGKSSPINLDLNSEFKPIRKSIQEANNSLEGRLNVGEIGPMTEAQAITNGYLKDVSKLNESTNSKMSALTSIMSLLATNIGTALGAKIGGPESAASAATGASLGGLGGTGIAALANVTNPIIGAFASGIGSIFGGILGGLFADDKPQERLDVITDNTKALKLNTETIRNLSTEFVDLRNELINAPSRFITPAQPGSGFRGNIGVGTNSNNISSNNNLAPNNFGMQINFNVQGNFDQAAADNAVQRISEIYSQQARQNSSNSRLFR